MEVTVLAFNANGNPRRLAVLETWTRTLILKVKLLNSSKRRCCNLLEWYFSSTSLALCVMCLGCAKDDQLPETSEFRTFALGFTNFPHDGTPAGVTAALNVIRNDGDLLVAHFDNGIPWDAALVNNFSQYPQDFRDEINFLVAARPSGHKLYLAVTPIAFLRNRLAPTRGPNGQQTFLAPWSGYAFDHPDVITAFINHCRIMINQFNPDFFTFGIEVNLVHEVAGDSIWRSYPSFAAAVYTSLRASYPGLPLIQSLQADSYYRNPTVQSGVIQQIIPYTDYIAISTYPFGDAVRYPHQSQANPAFLPASFFSMLADLAPNKPFAVAETVWPAEDVSSPYPVEIRSNESYQHLYVNALLNASNSLRAKFVCWFFTRDYDDFWNSTLSSDPNAALIRLCKDTGLYRGDGTSRPALIYWHSFLNRQRL